jgi:hypothetical protein
LLGRTWRNEHRDSHDDRSTDKAVRDREQRWVPDRTETDEHENAKRDGQDDERQYDALHRAAEPQVHQHRT